MNNQPEGRLLTLFVILIVLLGTLGIPASSVKATDTIAFTDEDSTAPVTAAFSEYDTGSITYVGEIGSATSKTSGTSLLVHTTAAVTEGDDIFVAYVSDPNQNLVVSMTDTAGNTYNQVGLIINSGNIRTYLFAAYDVNTLPASSDITITASPAVTARAAVVSVFRGLANNDILDQTSTGSGTSTTPSSGATATTTQPDELLIGVIGTEGPVGDAAGTWQNSFTAGPRSGTTDGTADTNVTISLGYQIVSATGAYTAGKSGITSRDWAAMIVTFKAGSTDPSPRITITDTPLIEFTSVPGNPSAEQDYVVSGSNLTENITITAPSGFEISETSGSGFGSSLTLTHTDGSVAETTIFVRLNSADEGVFSGDITHVSSGATTRSVGVIGAAAMPEYNILLGRPTDHSITVNMIPNQDSEVYYEYGTVSGTYPEQTPTYTAASATPHEIVIDGLSADTRYYYRLVSRIAGSPDWIAGEEYSFITQRAPDSSFTFTIISDSHFGQYGGQTEDEIALYQVALQNVLDDQPDFHIDLGDTFPMDPSPLGTGMTEEEADAAYLSQRPYLEPLSHSVPIYIIIGNHENEEGWNFDDVFTPPDQSIARVGLKYRKLYYPVPIPDDFYTGNEDPLSEPIGGDTNHEDYYAWTWGDALFVVLDPYHYSMTWPAEGGSYGGEGQDGEVGGDRWDWTLGIEQYLWLKETLENSTTKYKFVFSHHVTGGATVYGRGGIEAAPYFEWGGKNADGTWGWDTERPASEGWDMPVHQLMVENGVNVYFHGHDHIYAMEELDGIVYIECPKPDDAGYTWEPYGYGYNENLYPNGYVLPNSGHIRVTVSPADVTIDYVRAYLPGDGENGVVDHSTTIEPSVQSYDLTTAVSPGGGGTTDPAVGVHTYTEGTPVEISATPASGYVFDHWDGDCTGSTNPCTLTMNTDMDVTAYFAVESSGVLGDVNGDYAVNSTDALIILSGDVGVNIAQFCPANCGDVNDDGFVNSTDALIVLSYDAGMTIPFPLGQAGMCPADVTPCAGCNP